MRLAAPRRIIAAAVIGSAALSGCQSAGPTAPVASVASVDTASPDATITGSPAQIPGSAGTARPVTPSPSPVDEATRQVERLLTERSGALAAGDPGAWAATVHDPASAQGAREIAAYQGLQALGVRSLTVSDIRTLAPMAGDPPGVLTASVRLGYRIPGFDRADRVLTRTVSVAETAGRWRIVRWLGAGDQWEAFDLPGLQVAHTTSVLVAGPVPTEELLAQLAAAETGQGQVADVLGRATAAVVVVPTDDTEAAGLLGVAGSQIGSTVAATTHGRREPGRPAGADRVILRPSGLSRLTTAGRRVVLTHELTHVSLRAQSIHDLPFWLSEGFAEWVAFRDEGLPVRTIAAVLLERVRAQGPPRSLPTEADFAGQDGEAGVAAAYQGSWLAAQRIVRERGAQALVALLRELGGDPDVLAPVESAELAPDELALERAMSRHIGDGREQFVTLWRAELVALARY